MFQRPGGDVDKGFDVLSKAVLSPRANFVVAITGSLALNAAGLWLIAHTHSPFTLLAKKKPAPAPKIEIVVPSPQDDEMVIGHDNGVGESVNETLADQVQTALKKAEADQANQTRDPSGQRLADAGSPRAMMPTFAPPPEALPTPPPSQAVAPRKYEKPQPKPAPQPQQPQPNPTPPAPPATPGVADAGTPAEHSDRDSDIYAKETSVEFRDGRVVAQNGREIKFARPRQNLAAIVDTATIPFPALLTMRIRVDELGHVRNVQIVRSTGSRSLDRVFELAMYESWFEPSKDKAGRPISDESNFTMRID